MARDKEEIYVDVKNSSEFPDIYFLSTSSNVEQSFMEQKSDRFELSIPVRIYRLQFPKVTLYALELIERDTTK
jgi:hypothetical protein